MKTSQGILIVIDGIDGSGKTTQIELLTKYFSEKNIPFEVINFPRYGENIYAELVARYLDGEFGSLSEVNPYLISLSYGGDRLLAKPLIENWISEGKIVIANRYISASKAHMGANLEDNKRENFMRWIDHLEYETNRMPKEDFTILLSVDPKVGQENVSDSRKPDMHERNLKHLEEAQKIYLELSKAESNWQVIDCMMDGKMKSKGIIHLEILNLLKDKVFEH